MNMRLFQNSCKALFSRRHLRVYLLFKKYFLSICWISVYNQRLDAIVLRSGVFHWCYVGVALVLRGVSLFRHYSQVFFAELTVLQECPLKYYPQHKSCWLCRQLLYVTHLFFLFFFLFFFFFFILKLKKNYLFFLSSFCSFLCSFLLYLVFFSNLLSFHLSFPITLFCQLLPYVLLLFNLFSFYYLSSFRALYVILVCYLLYSCFCFL